MPTAPRGNGQVAGQCQPPDVDIDLPVHARGGRCCGVLHGRLGTRRRIASMCSFEEVDNRLIIDLPEVVVPLADRAQPRWLFDADDLVGVLGQRAHGFRGGDGHRQHDPRCAVCSGDVAGGAGGRAGGDAVVDEHRGTAGEVDARCGPAELVGPPLQLLALASFDSGEVGLGGPGETDDLVVDDADTIFADRPHRQLGLTRDSDLADDDDVEGRVERLRDLERNGDAAPREPEYDDVVTPKVLEARSERRASLRPVSEHPDHGHLLDLVHPPRASRW